MQVNYINAHATSTKVGDVAEVRALHKVFSNPSAIKMNATKSLIGHSLGASGGMEAIATIKAIQTSKLHPTLNQVSLSRPGQAEASTTAMDSAPATLGHHRTNPALLLGWGSCGLAHRLRDKPLTT